MKLTSNLVINPNNNIPMIDEDFDEEDNLIELQDNEPTFDPETCEAGGYDGLECDPQYDPRQDSWLCTTCNKRC